MAFPQVESLTPTQFPSSVTDHAVDMPGTVTAGDLLLIFIVILGDDGANNLSTPSGWTDKWNGDHADPNGKYFVCLYAKVAAGTEGGGTVTVVSNNAATGAAHVYRITGWGGELTDVECGIAAAASSGTEPNPPSLTATWGSEDNLWLAVGVGADDDVTFSGFPTNYTDGLSTVSGGGINNGVEVGSARRENATATEDPGVFTLESSEAWGANTIVIQPSAGGTVYYQSADGAFAPTGVLVKNTKTSKAGNFTLTGIITKKGFVPKAGAVTFSGAATRLPKKPLAGVFTFAGSLTSVAHKMLAGAFTFAGSLTKAISVSLAGVLTATGALAASLVGAIQQAVGGVLTFSGAVVNKAAKVLGGALTLNGAVVKKTMASLAGVFVAAGSVSNILTKVKSLAGVLSFSGSILKLTSVSLVGVVLFTGSIGKTIRRAFAGVLSFIGSGIGRLLGIGGPQELVSVSGDFTQLVEVEGEFTQFIEVSGELLEE